VRWLQIILADARFPYLMYVARDGAEALSFIEKRGRFTEAPAPDLVMVDLNLPKVPGIDVLHAIRLDEGLAETPVCVLSGSPIERATMMTRYELDVRCYIVKPITIESFQDSLNSYPRLKPFLEAWRGSAVAGN
jgi:CheY-like chemotaxis protein